MKKKQHTTIILAILLALALSFIFLNNYQKSQQEKQLDIFEQGAQYGYTQTVTQLFQQAITCEPVPIYVQNQTLNLIAVECLQTEE
jgi:hypothetical protein